MANVIKLYYPQKLLIVLALLPISTRTYGLCYAKQLPYMWLQVLPGNSYSVPGNSASVVHIMSV